MTLTFANGDGTRGWKGGRDSTGQKAGGMRDELSSSGGANEINI